MPIYEYRCQECGKKFEVLVFSTPDAVPPECTRCHSHKVERLLSRIRILKSEESRLESLADPTKFSGLDEKDPRSVARWVKKMGKEMGENLEDEFVDQMVEEAMEKREETHQDDNE